MPPRLRIIAASLLAALILVTGTAARPAEPPLKVAVLENSPPMSYRDADGRLTGFSIELPGPCVAKCGSNARFR